MWLVVASPVLQVKQRRYSCSALPATPLWRHGVLLLVILLIGSGPGSAWGADTSNTDTTAGSAPGLDYFVRAALERARSITAAREEREAAASATTAALGGLLPRLGASASYTRNQYEALGLRRDETTGADVPVVVIPRGQWAVDSSAALSLIDGTRWQRYAEARWVRRAATARTRVVTADVVLETARLYMTALAAQEMLRSAERAQAAAQADLELVEAQRRIGGATSLALARARLELQRARQRLVETRRATLQGLHRLATLCRTRQPRRLARVDVDTTPLAPTSSPGQTRPELIEARASYHATCASDRAATWALVPMLQIIGTHHVGNTPGFAGENSWYTAGLQLRLDLDLERIARSSQTAAQRRATAARLMETADRLEDELYQAQLDVSAGIETVQTAREAERVAIQAAEAARAQFRLGAGTQREVIEGERDRVEAEAQRVEAEATLVLARLRLARARGESLLDAIRRPSSPVAPVPAQRGKRADGPAPHSGNVDRPRLQSEHRDG